MADTLDTITKLIQSPPGQLAAGGVLAGIVWKFFERVEAVLTENTKLEIAVWLLGVKVGPNVEPWPETFARVFDRVFGTKHLSWQCFRRSCLASYVSFVVVLFVPELFKPYEVNFDWGSIGLFAAFAFGATVSTDYLSLLKTRRLLYRFSEHSNSIRILGFLLVDAIGSWVFAKLSVVIGRSLYFIWDESHYSYGKYWIRFGHQIARGVFGPSLAIWFYPAFFTSIWLWLYAGSGFILKAARRFDLGFDWFNRHFDIEKKPLQSIGLVAGAIVALVYWSAVLLSRLI